MTTISKTIQRRLPQAALAAEATNRFGPDAFTWRFRCTRCGRTQCAAELPPGRKLDVAQACFGCGLLAERAVGGDGQGLWLIRLPGRARETTLSFPLADELDDAIAPHPAPHGPAVTPGPARAENPPAPVSAPPRALCVERRDPGKRPGLPGDGAELLDLENWDYRVALTDDQAVLGYRGESGLTVMLADTAAWMCDAFHDLTPDLDTALRHIAAYDRPITETDLESALLLIRCAHAESDAAQASTELIPVQVSEAPGCYWTAEQGWLEQASDLRIDCSCHLSAPCSRCESLTPCPHCPTEVFVAADDMDAHLAAIHPEIAESEA